MDKAIRFIKKNLLSILVTCAVISFSLTVLFSVSAWIYQLFTVFIYFAAYSKKKLWTIKEYRLRKKGMSIEALRNAAFIKNWEETRYNGIWKYCLRDGGVITGAGLALPIGIIILSQIGTGIRSFFPGPGAMFIFDGYCYVAGAFLGAILFRIRWWYNERRYHQLTDSVRAFQQTDI